MIRSPAEAARLAWKIVEFAAQLLTFWLTNVVTHELALFLKFDLGVVGDLLGLAIAAIVGATLPSLMFARPRIRVEWEVDGEPASGVAQVDLRGRSRREFTFRAETYVHHESLLGWAVASALVRKARDAEIAFNPTGSATRLKKQSQAGNARLHNGTILLPTTNAARGSQQAMFYGSIVPVFAGARYKFDTDANLITDNRFTRWYVNVETGVTGIRIME